MKRAKAIRPATLDELARLVTAMPERWQAMTLIAAWCGLRFGELTELRRSDVDLDQRVIRVRRAVTHVDGRAIVSTPKSGAGLRDVAVPPHLIPVFRDHLRTHAQFGRDGLLFPSGAGTHLRPATLYGRVSTSGVRASGFYAAREAAGRPDLRWHDLRHTGAVLTASTGATLVELMARLGHSTSSAALRYLHVAEDRDQVIAARLSELATVTVGSA